MVRGKAKLLYDRNKRPGLLFDDLEAELWLVFMKCVQGWTPARGELSTYFYGAVAKEEARIVGRSFGFSTPYQRQSQASLKAAASSNLDEVRTRFWPRTQYGSDPLGRLIRDEDLGKARAMMRSVSGPEAFLVAAWLRGVNRNSVLATMNFGGTTLTTWRHRTFSRMALARLEDPDAQPQDPSLAPE